ncbi:MAG: EAL domain-containing protein [Gammaproteobacteria bacterium]|nr:EAL domain-containing protein [Gammaproteobacteria bacterium]
MPSTQIQSGETDKNSRERRAYNAGTINQAFNNFLRLENLDKTLLLTYQDALHQGGERFTKIFYDYLLASPTTAKVLEDYQAGGGKIDDLIKRQLQHLWALLSGHIDDESARHLAHVGEVHYRHGIEPVWIMGAYLLYLNHLQTLIRTSSQISDAHRPALENSVTKLLFRDMGLLLEGYWDASLRDLKKEKDKVAELQEQITGLLSNIPQLLWSVDVVNNRPIYVSPSAREICQMDIDMPIPCLGWTVPEDRETVRHAWRKALAGSRVEVESRVKQPDGSLRWFRRIFYPYANTENQVVRIDGLMEDTTDAKKMIDRLHTLATTDNLTGLPNRTLFNDRLEQAIVAAERDSDKQVGLILMDLNRFKEINDTLGHPAGDQVLVMVAQRLRAALREPDTLTRLGGDEFAILLPDIRDGRKTVERVIKKITQCFNTPFLHGDNELFLGAGIGIVLYPEHGQDASTLMSRADVAMYGTKNRDIGYLYYDAALDPNASQQLQLSGDLHQALQREEFILHYQPQIDIETGLVTGVEALIRWRHPVHGLIPPDQFIPLAERTGVIRPITYWVLETAVRQCRIWRNAGHPLRVAVNVSGRIFHDPAFVERVENILKAAGTPAECLEMEITENMLMADIDSVSHILEKIHQLGIHIAIDDFGTGYSSLAYLKKLPLRTLKIDKSFVLDMAKDENDAVIVRSTIDLAHNLGYQVVAEGIENQDTWDLLHILGCDGGQGFHMCHPLPAEDFAHWLRSWPGNVVQ